MQASTAVITTSTSYRRNWRCWTSWVTMGSSRRCLMKNSQKTLWMHMRPYFTVFLPKQRNASQHTITACQDTWNLFLRYLSSKKGIRLETLGFADIDSSTVVSFLDTMESERNWKPSTRNQRLSCIRSFMHYAACMEPTLYAYAAELDGIPLKKMWTRAM